MVDDRLPRGSGVGDVPKPDQIRAEAVRLSERAAQRGLTLRIIGSIAVQLHCPAHADLLGRLGRRPVRDIDLVGYAREQAPIEAMFEDEGWLLDPVIQQAREYGISRLIYVHPVSHQKVDVFLDRLVMSHTIDLRPRLALAAPVVTPADLLLSKLQIHEITENDLLDLVVLFATHELGDGRAGTIDLPYVLGILCGDWGFSHAVSLNLERLRERVERGDVPPDAATLVAGRIAALEEVLDRAPKTRRWRLRAAVGTRAPWYQDVDEVERGA